MTIAETMTRQARERAGALLSEPLIDVAFANRYGTLSTIVKRTALRIATDITIGEAHGAMGVPKDEIQREGAKAVPLPSAFLLAVTSANIHVFAIKMFMGNVKVKDALAVFERAGLELVVQDDTLVTVFRMHAPRQGNDMTFEIMKSDYGHDFAALLRQARGDEPVIRARRRAA